MISVEIRLLAEAKEDIRNQDDSKKLAEEIKSSLSDLDQKKVEAVDKPSYDMVFQRFKLKKHGFDHRVFFHYIDSKLVIFAVRHRDFAYEPDEMNKAVEKFKELRE